MKLIKQVQLFFQEGSSDKVYEIDLLEAGEGYLVNFRYGRRGASLKEGTKTVFPVALSEAEKIFDSLEQEKRKKGYVAAGEAQLITTEAASPAKAKTDKRKKAILSILKAAAAEGDEPENWPLSRVIWRAGNLKITETVPYIIKLVSPDDDFIMVHSAIYAIGRCGTEKAIPYLKSAQTKKELPEFTRALATEALLKLTGGKEKEELIQSIITSLPAPLQKHLLSKQYHLLEKQLRELLFDLKTVSNEYLIGIYQISRQDAELYKRFCSIVSELPLQFNYFKYLRHIFKTAEMLEDYAIYGIIAKNIEKQSAGYKAYYWYSAEEKSKKAFSEQTKGYLTQRVVRTLSKYGEANESSYTELATELLLAFDDAKDLAPPRSTSETRYLYDAQTRNYSVVSKVTHFDSYSGFQAFNYILYKNSPRYIAGKKGWKCVAPYLPGSPAPETREEAFPYLWNKASEEIIELLCLSKAERVHEFANKVFLANSEFESQIETKHIIQFLLQAFKPTQQLGLTLAKKKYNKNNPDKLLLIALLDSELKEARELAQQWIEEQKSVLISDADFLVKLFQLKTLEAHVWVRSFLYGNIIPKEASEIVISKIIADLVSAELNTEAEQRFAAQTGETLLAVFSEQLKFISLEIVKDLFRHSSPVIHSFAGKILLNHTTSPENLPEDFLQILLQSDNTNSRGIGIALLGKFPEKLLMERKEILVSFCLSPLPDVRSAVKPIILKLVNAYTEFGKELVTLFVPAFLMKESYEGLHDDLLHLLSNELKDALAVIPKEKTLLLLNSKFRTAQLTGALLLRHTIREEELSVPELVKLASNPLLDIRTFAWQVFKKDVVKIKTQKEEALRITDSYWADTRIFAFDYFRTNFSSSDWTEELLVSLCDSTKEDVQDFGREMITRSFKEENGEEYLLKLSQHPNTKIQLFSSSYLETYAGSNTAIIEKLKPYFITLLSQVNKGKVAKARAMSFLRQESLKNETTAKIASEIFTRVSVSVAITERAECIEALRDIQKKYPALAAIIHRKAYPDYIKA